MVLKRYVEAGVSFGLTSGIITTLGMIVGLNAGTSSREVVIGGILTIAIADALSDALGMHTSEESENKYTNLQIWKSTLITFATKFTVTLSFLAPVLIYPLREAVIFSVAWGLLMLGLLNYFIAKQEKKNPWIVITEHTFIAILVILATNLAGYFITSKLG